METLTIKTNFEEILKEAVAIGNNVAAKYYDEYEKNWYPCGNAHIVLNGVSHRRLINHMKKTAFEERSRVWRGSYGMLSKVSNGFWWSIPLRRDSQSMNYKLEIYRAIQVYFATQNIAVELGSYID